MLHWRNRSQSSYCRYVTENWLRNLVGCRSDYFQVKFFQTLEGNVARTTYFVVYFGDGILDCKMIDEVLVHSLVLDSFNSTAVLQAHN